jgi:hypothetical protein
MLSNNINVVNDNDLNNQIPAPANKPTHKPYTAPQGEPQPPLQESDIIDGKPLEFATELDKARYYSYKKEFESYGLVSLRSKTCVVKPSISDGRTVFDFCQVRDFHDFHRPDTYYVLEENARGDKEPRRKRFSEVWHDSQDLCNRFNQVEFNLDPNFKNPNVYNLWRGMIEPKKGNVQPFLAHLRNLIVDESGKGTEYTFVLKLMAWVLQNPNVTPEVLLLFIGGQGDGKSTITQIFRRFFPSNVMTTDNLEKYLKWNSASANCKVVGLEEAFSTGNYLVQNMLKNMVTNTHRLMEAKGKDPFEISNKVFYIGTSNSERPFSIDEDDRRTAVIATKRAGNRDYFNKFYQWLDNEGAPVILEYLLKLDLKTFDRKDIPNTRARALLKVNSLPSVEKFVLNLLSNLYDSRLNIVDWEVELRLDREPIFELYRDSTKTPYDYRSFSTRVGKIFDFPKNWSDNWRSKSTNCKAATSYYRIDPLKVSREKFANFMKSTVEDIFNN